MKRTIFAVALICMTASLIGCTKRAKLCGRTLRGETKLKRAIATMLYTMAIIAGLSYTALAQCSTAKTASEKMMYCSPQKPLRTNCMLDCTPDELDAMALIPVNKEREKLATITRVGEYATDDHKHHMRAAMAQQSKWVPHTSTTKGHDDTRTYVLTCNVEGNMSSSCKPLQAQSYTMVPVVSSGGVEHYTGNPAQGTFPVEIRGFEGREPVEKVAEYLAIPCREYPCVFPVDLANQRDMAQEREKQEREWAANDARERATRTQTWKSIGLRLGMSQGQVKAILAVHGFKVTTYDENSPNHAKVVGFPWVCEPGWNANHTWYGAHCLANSPTGTQLRLEFTLGRRSVNPDTGLATDTADDKLTVAKFGQDDSGNWSFDIH